MIDFFLFILIITFIKRQRFAQDVLSLVLFKANNTSECIASMAGHLTLIGFFNFIVIYNVKQQRCHDRQVGVVVV